MYWICTGVEYLDLRGSGLADKNGNVREYMIFVIEIREESQEFLTHVSYSDFLFSISCQVLYFRQHTIFSFV